MSFAPELRFGMAMNLDFFFNLAEIKGVCSGIRNQKKYRIKYHLANKKKMQNKRSQKILDFLQKENISIKWKICFGWKNKQRWFTSWQLDLHLSSMKHFQPQNICSMTFYASDYFYASCDVHRHALTMHLHRNAWIFWWWMHYYCRQYVTTMPR